MELSEEYYEALGISRGATTDEIKKAYRKMALKWHPDKNLERREVAEMNFKRLSEAYEVLSDPNRRQVYDRFGKDGLSNGAGTHDFEGPGAAFTGFNGFGFPAAGFFGGQPEFFNNMFRDPEEVFRSFFGADDPFAAFFGNHEEPQSSGHQSGGGQPSDQMSSAASIFMNPFSMFGGMGGMGGMDTMSIHMSSSSSGSGRPTVKRVSTTVKMVNGKRVETKRRDPRGAPIYRWWVGDGNTKEEVCGNYY